MITTILSALLKPLAWLLGLLGLRWDARRDERRDAELRRAKDTLLAERLRKETDDDLETESDLRARAVRSGLVRPRPE